MEANTLSSMSIPFTNMTPLLFLLLPFLTVLVAIPFLKRISSRYGLYDVSEGDSLKIHQVPISYLGGAALFIACAIGLMGLGFFNIPLIPSLLVLLMASLPVFFLGLWDDLKWKHISTIKPITKFFLLLVAPLVSSFLLSLGEFSFFGDNLFSMIFVSAFATFVLMNAVNYQDGMDGLAGGLSAISFAGFFIAGFLTGNVLVVGVSLILLGAVIGFLVFNFPPATIFMGDSGAYFLGFYLAFLGLFFAAANGTQGILASVFIVGVPLFEGGFTNLRRIMRGKSLFLGDRNHVYDRLLQKGYPAKKVLLLFYTAQLAFVIIGILLS